MPLADLRGRFSASGSQAGPRLSAQAACLSTATDTTGPERFGVLVAKLGQVPLEEKVQEGSYNRNCTELPDLLPAWRDRGLDDVGCELESEAGDEPASVAHQDLTERPVRHRRRKRRPQPGEESLDGSDGDDDQRHRI